MVWPTYRGIDIEVVGIVAQGGVSDAQAVEHAKHAGTVGDLMEALHADEASNAAAVERRKDVTRLVDKTKRLRAQFKEVVEHVDLLQSSPQRV